MQKLHTLKKFSLLLFVIIALSAGFLVVYESTSLKANIKSFMKEKLREDFLDTVDTSNTQIAKKEISNPILTIAFLSDSHNFNSNVDKAVQEINNTNATLVFGLGDYTDVGTDQEFQKFNTSIAKLNKKKYILPGDHDLWNGRDKTEDAFFYFHKYFPELPVGIKEGEIEFIFVNNADIYQGINEDELAELIQAMQKSTAKTLVLLSHRAIKHPLTIHTMGYINDKKIDPVYKQAEQLEQAINKIQDKKVYLIHGDLHTYSEYQMGEKVAVFSIGALAEERNFQKPRYAIGIIDNQGTLHIQDVPLSQ